MFPYVRKGQKYIPNAAFHNAAVRLVNDFGRIGDGEFKGRSGWSDSAAYDGPFAVKRDDDGGGFFSFSSGVVWAGTEKIAVPGGKVRPGNLSNDLSSDFYFYLVIRYSSGYSAKVVYSSSRDGLSQTDSEYVVLLAWWKDGKITQLQHGDIYIAGRVV
ncbi:MAG: hypothetical protein J5654_09725 [Victivallales bacterium]|nr:hypothetical protein [Victivallales bacterium]